MQQKDARTIQAELAKPFAPEDLEWRLQRADKDGRWGIAVPYVTNRAIQNRLDEVVGPELLQKLGRDRGVHPHVHAQGGNLPGHPLYRGQKVLFIRTAARQGELSACGGAFLA